MDEKQNAGFNLQPLTQEVIDEIFESAEHQADYTIALYRRAYPTLWERIKKVKGFPAVSKETNEYIFQRAIDFDKKHHPDVFAGGMWMNNGFKSKDCADNWKVYPCEVELKGA